MNTPIPAIDENGEFVVAVERCGGRSVVYTLDNGAGRISGDSRWWRLDGTTITDLAEYDIINLDELRATVERARKLRADRDHELEMWRQVWTSLNDMGAGLGDANKPLAVTASWALLKREVDAREAARPEPAARPTVRYDPDGAASTDSKSAVEHVLKSRDAGDERCRPPPASPTFAEALEEETKDWHAAHGDKPVTAWQLWTIVKCARRASEGK